MSESRKGLDNIIKDLNPPKRMIEILAIPDEKERNRQTALWACEFGFDELRSKPLPTRPEKIIEYYKLHSKERYQWNNQSDKYAKFWNDETVRRYFNDCDLIRTANRQNREWLETLKYWLDPTQDPKEFKMITDRLYDFGNVDLPQEANWNEHEEV